MSCLNPEPCSGNCPSPLSWLAFAHKTVTLVLTGIYRWGKRAVTHTHTQAADHKRTHKLKLEFLNVHTHTQVHTQRQIVRIPTHIFVVFYVCVCVCVGVQEMGVFISPRQQCREASESTVSRPLWAKEHWSLCQLKEMESPFSLSAIVRVWGCVCARMVKAMRRQEESGLALNSVTLL